MDPLSDRATACNILLTAPIGSAGFWDEQSGQPNTITLDELPTLGYTILYRWSQTAIRPIPLLRHQSSGRQVQTYVVIRKDKPGELPGDLAKPQ